MLQRTNIYLPKSMLLYLKQEARQQRTTLAQLVRSILSESIKKPRTKKTWAESLLELANNAPKGRYTDLSINHDEYLYGSKRIK
ncbi:MAG TPA: hypothetical protein VJL83_03825 [Patescibacteria group bacterium]|nr:hypothetical protein [Patescibacteria group bacterium]